MLLRHYSFQLQTLLPTNKSRDYRMLWKYTCDAAIYSINLDFINILMSRVERMTGWAFLFAGIVILLIGIAMFFGQGIVGGESIGRLGGTMETSFGPYGCFGIATFLFIMAIIFLRKQSSK